MSYFFATLIFVCVFLILVRIFVVNKDKVAFYAKGLDYNFRRSEIKVLWKLAQENELEDPSALYVSLPLLNRCINAMISKAHKSGTEHSFHVQNLLTKLYDFRTRVALEEEEKKGLENTKSLEKGQKMRIVLKGSGVFFSHILNNGQEIVISLPKQDGKVKYKGNEWEGKEIIVFVWRKGDAMYSFNSKVYNSGIFQGTECLYISQGTDLRRAQKRQSIRSSCSIYAQMYMIRSEVVDFDLVEDGEGFRCLLENISEDGAMIRIGGRGKTNVQIKLQFTLNDTFIMMYGVIRSVEYNSQLNQSRLHFECTHINPVMKNAILSYVYKVVTPEQKEIHEAIQQSEKDALDSGDSPLDAGEEPVIAENENIREEDIADDIEINALPEMELPVHKNEESVKVNMDYIASSADLKKFERENDVE